MNHLESVVRLPWTQELKKKRILSDLKESSISPQQSTEILGFGPSLSVLIYSTLLSINPNSSIKLRCLPPNLYLTLCSRTNSNPFGFTVVGNTIRIWLYGKVIGLPARVYHKTYKFSCQNGILNTVLILDDLLFGTACSSWLIYSMGRWMTSIKEYFKWIIISKTNIVPFCLIHIQSISCKKKEIF